MASIQREIKGLIIKTVGVVEIMKQEVKSILDLVERDLAEASKVEISKDWRFNIAYNAGLQPATVVLYSIGSSADA